MKKSKITHPDRDPKFVTGAYSDGVLVNGMLFLSGQASVDFKSSKFIIGTIEEETIRTLDNIKAIVESAGGSMNDAIKSTVHLSDINDFDRTYEIIANAIQSGLYEQRLPYIRKMKHKILNEMQFFPRIEKIINGSI